MAYLYTTAEAGAKAKQTRQDKVNATIGNVSTDSRATYRLTCNGDSKPAPVQKAEPQPEETPAPTSHTDTCPICGDACEDDLDLYGVCAECHYSQHRCEHCKGAGEVWERVSPFISADSPHGLHPVRCECCDGTGAA